MNIGVVVFGAVLLSGCAADTSANEEMETAESIFLEQWSKEFPGSKPEAAIGVAKDICEDYKAGTSFRSEVDFLRSMGSTYEQAGAMIGMATVTYCPEFKNRQ